MFINSKPGAWMADEPCSDQSSEPFKDWQCDDKPIRTAEGLKREKREKIRKQTPKNDGCGWYN